VEGSVQTLKLFGELNIRRALSKSHLPSSFFVVDYVGSKIVLAGGGWGHGVGLCQLGAVAMAKAGFTVEEILDHYYPGAKVGNG
jgi:SpoIID/LytB domain protein